MSVSHLCQVLPAVVSALGVPVPEDPAGLGAASLPDADAAVVLLVDGLGLELLASRGSCAPLLSSQVPWEISAGFPTTTAAGLGALGTGLPAGAHGLVAASFWIPEADLMLHPLRWGSEPPDYVVSPERTVFERAVAGGLTVRAVSPRAYHDSGLTRSVLRGAEYRGADGIGERLVESVTAGHVRRSLTYVYWGELDRTGHVHGWQSEHWSEELRTVDAFVERLRSALPPSTDLYVTADHGMVDCATRIDLDLPPFTEGVVRLGGEPRCRHVYTRPGASADVRARWSEALGESALVLSRDEACLRAYTGPVHYAERVGDVVAVAQGDAALVSDRTDRIVSSLRGQHGADSMAESRVPLIRVA